MEKQQIENHTILYKIEGEKFLEVSQVTIALDAIAGEYAEYVKKISPKSDPKLLIYKLSKGSLITEFITAQDLLATATGAYLTPELSWISGYGYYLDKMKDFFIKTITHDTPQDYTIKSADRINKVINPVTTDNAKSMILNVSGNNNNIYIGGEWTKDNCKRIEDNVAVYKDLFKSESLIEVKHQEFRWSATLFSHDSKGATPSDKGNIKNLDDIPHKVTFNNEEDKKFMTSHNARFEADWQELVYLVDVAVVKVQDKISSYTITKVYREETRTE